MKFIFALFLFVSISLTAQANIQSDIDACEQNGGDSCVFDILRRLATQKDGVQDIFLRKGKYNTCGHSCSSSGAQSVEHIGRFLTFGSEAPYRCRENVCSNGSDITIEILSSRTFVRATSLGIKLYYREE